MEKLACIPKNRVTLVLSIATNILWTLVVYSYEMNYKSFPVIRNKTEKI